MSNQQNQTKPKDAVLRSSRCARGNNP